MYQKNNLIYQHVINSVRWRNIRGLYWPGKPVYATAATRYPNVVAEIEASGMYLWCPAEHAGVSKEIMAAVLEDGEELSLKEMRGLAHLYRCRYDYLAAPVLATIDPATNKGKFRFRQLSGLIEQADGLEVLNMWMFEQTRDTMERGEPVTYASWRWACQEINDALGYRRRSIRTERAV